MDTWRSRGRSSRAAQPSTQTTRAPSTPLAEASQYGHLNTAQELLDHRAGVNAQNLDLWTPLHHSSAEGHLNIVKLLIHRSAQVDKPNNDQWTPLHPVARYGQLRFLVFSSYTGQVPAHLIAKVRHQCTRQRQGHLNVANDHFVERLVGCSAPTGGWNSLPGPPISRISAVVRCVPDPRGLWVA